MPDEDDAYNLGELRRGTEVDLSTIPEDATPEYFDEMTVGELIWLEQDNRADGLSPKQREAYNEFRARQNERLQVLTSKLVTNLLPKFEFPLSALPKFEPPVAAVPRFDVGKYIAGQVRTPFLDVSPPVRFQPANASVREALERQSEATERVREAFEPIPDPEPADDSTPHSKVLEAWENVASQREEREAMQGAAIIEVMTSVASSTQVMAAEVRSQQILTVVLAFAVIFDVANNAYSADGWWRTPANVAAAVGVLLLVWGVSRWRTGREKRRGDTQPDA